MRFSSVVDYIPAQPVSHQKGLRRLRQTIRKTAPEAEEVISYNMPAYKFQGVLVYFAAHTSHISFYALPGPIVAFKEKLKSFTTSKGTVQFPLGRALPVKLIADMVRFRVKENLERKSRQLKAKIK